MRYVSKRPSRRVENLHRHVSLEVEGTRRPVGSVLPGLWYDDSLQQSELI